MTILGDTAAFHSFVLGNVLPLSDETSCFSDLPVWRIQRSELNAPLRTVHLFSPLVTGHVKVAVLPRFPINGVSFILGNDLAGGNVFPLPEVTNDPILLCLPAVPDGNFRWFFVKCVPCVRIYTRTVSKDGETVDLSESVLATLDEGEPCFYVNPTTECKNVKCAKL